MAATRCCPGAVAWAHVAAIASIPNHPALLTMSPPRVSHNPAVASRTAGQASFAMNFTLLFSLVFTGFLVNVNSIPGAA